VPPGVPPGLVTVAVRVTDCPTTLGFAEDVSVVVVGGKAEAGPAQNAVISAAANAASTTPRSGARALGGSAVGNLLAMALAARPSRDTRAAVAFCATMCPSTTSRYTTLVALSVQRAALIPKSAPPRLGFFFPHLCHTSAGPFAPHSRRRSPAEVERPGIIFAGASGDGCPYREAQLRPSLLAAARADFP
jgi:hypothetical protein